MVVELRRTLIECESWCDNVVVDSDEKFQDKTQDLSKVFSALLSWVLAKLLSKDAVRRAATSSTQNRLETRTGDRLTFGN